MQNFKNSSMLSLREFKELCDNLSPKRFIFSSENQLRKGIYTTANISVVFPTMLVAFNPNTVCFKNDTGFLSLERVKYIKKDQKNCALGDIFTIVCGDYNNELNDNRYTIVAS